MTAAQTTKLSTEALTDPGAAAQAVKLSTEALTATPDRTAQAVRLSPEVLASVLLAGPGQLIRLPVETAGNLPDVSAQMHYLASEAAGTVPDVTAQLPTFWVDALLSVQEAGPAQLVALPVEVCAPIDSSAQINRLCVEVLMVPYIRSYPCLDRAPAARTTSTLQGTLTAAYIDRDAHVGCVEAQPSTAPNKTPQSE